MTSKITRNITKVFSAPLKNEGDGVKVHRVIGSQHLKNLDPFLMLDYASFKLPAGFPDHPHRGFETVSYILSGTSLHEDFKGNKGKLEAGDIQWMTAGKGIVHSEMPGSFTETTEGFQLWINLEKKNKMCEPAYQEIKAANLPIVTRPGIWVRLIAGEALGQKGPIFTRTPTFYMDVRLEKNTTFEQFIPSDFQGMIFLYGGSVTAGNNNRPVGDKQAAVFDPEAAENLVIVSGPVGAKFILFAGRPINEPVFNYGPFVMDSQQRLNNTFDDYQQGINGFEGAHEWESEIKNLAYQKIL